MSLNHLKSTLVKLNVLIVFGSLFLINSCTQPLDETQPCLDHTENYKLSDYQKALIPYLGNETISMLSNIGDTIFCIGSGKQYFTTSEFVPHPHPSCSWHGTEKIYEAYSITFLDSPKVNLNLTFFSQGSRFKIDFDNEQFTSIIDYIGATELEFVNTIALMDIRGPNIKTLLNFMGLKT
jgi:hypothetical protein